MIQQHPNIDQFCFFSNNCVLWIKCDPVYTVWIFFNTDLLVTSLKQVYYRF